MGCATNSVKIASIVFNVILAIVGVGGIGWMLYNTDTLNENIAIYVYVACSLIVLFSFLGCYAAIRESVCLTATCAIFLLLLAILQITLTCLHMNIREKRTGAATVGEAWQLNDMDALQMEYECCGKASAQDYVLLNKEIPSSCYADQKMSETKGLFLEGCSAKLQDHYDTQLVRYAIVSWLLIAFEILGFLLAAFLVINFRNTQRRMQF